MRGHVTVRGHPVTYESALERDNLVLLSLDPTVIEVVGQPVTIHYVHPGTGRRTRYTPDLLVRHGGAEPAAYLLEVKYRADLWGTFWQRKPAYLAARRHARENGMAFRFRTEVEVRGARVRNVRFLRGYLDLAPDPAIEEQLAATLATIGPSTPQGLLAATFYSELYQARALPYLWRLVGVRRITLDLDLPLTMASRIGIIVGEGYTWTDPYSYRSPRDRSFDPPDGPTGSNRT